MPLFHQATKANTFLSDTRAIIEFLSKNPVPLTKKHQHFPFKLLHQLNELCSSPELDVTPRSPQYFFPFLHLMRYLLEAGTLFREEYGKRGVHFTPSHNQIQAYFNLNAQDQYIFWLKTMWEHLSLKKVSTLADESRYFCQSWGRCVLALLHQEEEMTLLKKGLLPTHFMKSNFLVWEAMGLMELEKVESASGRSYWQVGHHRFTPLGRTVLPFLMTNRPVGLWAPLEEGMSHLDGLFFKPVQYDAPFNQLVEQQDLPFGLPYVYVWEEDRVQELTPEPQNRARVQEFVRKLEREYNSNRSFEETFSPVCKVDHSLVIPDKIVTVPQSANYLIKVALKYQKSIWRKIKLSGEDTFESLHLVIQEAFMFDNDHLYRFCLDNKSYSRNIINGSDQMYGEEPPFSNRVKLNEGKISLGKPFLYIFDFGDSWEFECTLEEVLEEELVASPEVVAIKGKAPKQYPDYNQDEW